MLTAFIKKHSFNLEQLFFEDGARSNCTSYLHHWQSDDSLAGQNSFVKVSAFNQGFAGNNNDRLTRNVEGNAVLKRPPRVAFVLFYWKAN